jgi:hypothetical protein
VSWLRRDTGNLRLCRLIAEDIEQEAEPPKERDSAEPSHEDIEQEAEPPKERDSAEPSHEESTLNVEAIRESPLHLGVMRRS